MGWAACNTAVVIRLTRCAPTLCHHATWPAHTHILPPFPSCTRLQVEQKQDNGSDYPFLQTTKFTLLDGRVVDVGNPVHCIQYTVELDNRKGHCVCSQTLYFRLSDDNTINKIDLLCGGVNKQSD